MKAESWKCVLAERTARCEQKTSPFFEIACVNLSQARRGKPHCGNQSRFERLIRLTIRKKIDTRIGELAPVAQLLQIVDEVQAVHSRNFIASVRFDNLTVFEASST